MESSVGWTISDDGGWAGGVGGSRSVVSFDNSGDGPRKRGDGGDEATVQTAAPASIVRSLHSISSFASESKSIFELSRRYVGLALCSSGQTVVPVRLGRAVVDATVPPGPSSPASQNGSLSRPAPPPRAVTRNTQNAGAARRVFSPRASAGLAMVPKVGCGRSFAPASPTQDPGGGGGGAAADACAEWEASSSKLPNENDWHRRFDNEPAAVSRRQRSPSPTRAGVDVTGTSLENTNSSDQDAETVRDGCSRGRRCEASPTHERSASSERLREGPEIRALLAKYNRIDAHDCPVSPFSMPPSWADTPPSATMEPLGIPPPNKTPGDITTVLEGRAESAAEGHVGGSDPCMSLAEVETRETSVARPLEKTVFQKIASGRRASFGWGWKRPPGDRERRRQRKGLSPRERKLWSGINLGSVYPPTS